MSQFSRRFEGKRISLLFLWEISLFINDARAECHKTFRPSSLNLSFWFWKFRVFLRYKYMYKRRGRDVAIWLYYISILYHQTIGRNIYFVLLFLSKIVTLRKWNIYQMPKIIYLMRFSIFEGRNCICSMNQIMICSRSKFVGCLTLV